MNPKTAMWFNIALAVLGFLVGAGALLTPVFGTGITQEIVSVSGLVLGLVSAINTILHGVSAPTAGPMLTYFKQNGA